MGIALPSVPSLDSERLTMRGHALEDFDDYTAMWGDPKVTRHIGGRPLSREECWTRLLRNVGHWQLSGFGYWLVRERASGRFVGEVGFADLKRDLEPSVEGLPEIGWVLAPWSYGQGFATEAARAAIGWIDRDRSPKRTVCLIDADNAASLRVAAKLDYREFARSTYKGAPVIVFER
jgi:RimJ/RimL family protein N-acetyltransferase